MLAKRGSPRRLGCRHAQAGAAEAPINARFKGKIALDFSKKAPLEGIRLTLKGTQGWA